MKSIDNKIQAFEYVLYKLNEWYKEVYPDKEDGDNDISILKAMKLLFFVSNINTSDTEGEYKDLLDIFDNFQAWPYGHVETDVYNNYKTQAKNINIDRHLLIINNDEEIKNYTLNDIDLFSKIDKSIEYLKKENLDLIKKEAFDLVELSHAYFSWDYYYNFLKNSHQTILLEVLRNERKYY